MASPFKGTNFMTQHVLYKKRIKPGLWVELSTDTGDWARIVEGESPGRPLVGVTVLRADGTDPNNLSKCFRSIKEAQEYISSLIAGDQS